MDFSPASGSNTYLPEDKKLRYEADDFIDMGMVPIFDEHSGAEKDLDIYFDKAVLQQIIDNTNHRIFDTNDLVPLFLGHLRDDQPEEEQGTLVGFADQLTLGEIGELNPRPCIYARFRYFKDKAEEARQYPRRSVEIYVDDLIFDCIALLKRTPQRNLGVLFSKNKKRIAKYSRSIEPKETMDKEEIVKACLEAMCSTPVYKYWEEKMKGEDEAVKMEKGLVEPKVEDGTFPKEVEDKKVKMENEEEVDDMEEDDEKPEKVKMQRDQLSRKYAKLEAGYKNLEARVALSEKRERLAERKADLLALEGEGIEFDMASELEDVADLEPVRYQKHLSKMKKFYNRAPIGVKFTPVELKRTREITSHDPWAAADLVVKGQAKDVKQAFEMLGN